MVCEASSQIYAKMLISNFKYLTGSVVSYHLIFRILASAWPSQIFLIYSISFFSTLAISILSSSY